jgi:hypothetical protein
VGEGFEWTGRRASVQEATVPLHAGPGKVARHTHASTHARTDTHTLTHARTHAHKHTRTHARTHDIKPTHPISTPSRDLHRSIPSLARTSSPVSVYKWDWDKWDWRERIGISGIRAHIIESCLCRRLKALEMKADIQARRAQNQLGVIVWQVSAAAAASSAAIPLFPLSRFLAFTRLFFALVPFVH